jgi:hypothetical protein
LGSEYVSNGYGTHSPGGYSLASTALPHPPKTSQNIQILANKIGGSFLVRP